MTESNNRGRWRRVALILGALLFFTGPGIAGALGAEPKTIDNRPLVPFPSLADGWGFFPGFNRWATDHLPLRDRAVEANSDVSEHVFGEFPATAGSAPTVILGRDGWLFYQPDINLACAWNQNRPPLDGFQRFSALTERAGKRLITVIPPDKTTIETDRLPAHYPSQACGTAGKAALWDRLRTNPPPGYVDLLEPIRQVEQQAGAAYRKGDTHLADRGSAAMAMRVAGAIDPSVLARTELVSLGLISVPGDLYAMRGRPGPSLDEGVELRRPGVTSAQVETSSHHQKVYEATSTSTDAPLIPARTLLIGDSFGLEVLPFLRPFFAQLTFLPYQMAAPADFAALLADYDVVVFEEVERSYVMSPTNLYLTPEFVASVEKELPGTPARQPVSSS